MPVLGECAVCGAQSRTRCISCKRVYYCSDVHRVMHWDRLHKEECEAVYRAVKLDKMTQGKLSSWVAQRDLEAGKLLLKESAVIRAPLYYYDVKYKCISCGGGMKSDGGGPMEICKRCKWPVCSETCAEDQWHLGNECPIFTEAGFTPATSLNFGNDDLTYMIMMIRGQGLEVMKPEVYIRLGSLPLYVGEGGMPSMKSKFMGAISALSLCLKKPREELQEYEKIFKIAYVNAFQSEQTYFPGATAEQVLAQQPLVTRRVSNLYLYARASRIRHSCAPNCRYTISPDHDAAIRIFTAVPVKKGDHLTICFNDSPDGLVLRPTFERRERLYTQFGFWCQCHRCQDPYELLTMYAAVACRGCYRRLPGHQNNYFVPQPNEGICMAQDWVCLSCGAVKSFQEIAKIVNECRSDLLQASHRSVRALSELINECSENLLHPNHFLLQEAKSWIGVNENRFYYKNLSLEEIDNMIELYDHQWRARRRFFRGYNYAAAIAGLNILPLITEKLTRFSGTINRHEVVAAAKRFQKFYDLVRGYYAFDGSTTKGLVNSVLTAYREKYEAAMKATDESDESQMEMDCSNPGTVTTE